jgi:D-amino-acid dehydrogenase
MATPADVIVLGAGMVGVSVALHLQKRGRDVVLIDRRGAGEETSYGNSGLIQREGVIPYTFPREFGAVLSYAMNHRSDVVYHLAALPRLAPWLFRYWQNAAPKYIERSARALAPLMAQCVNEHETLIAQAGVAARALVRQNGWIRCLRTEASLREKIAEARSLDQYGIDYAVLTGAQLRELEPHVSKKIVGAIHFRGSPTSSDPGMLTQAYADLFVRKGGHFLKEMRDASPRTLPAGASRPRTGRFRRARRSWRSAPGRTTSFVRLATTFRWRSSADITCITEFRATPRSAIPCTTPTAATCSCRCARAFA